eukprot:Pgem_evm2s9386
MVVGYIIHLACFYHDVVVDVLNSVVLIGIIVISIFALPSRHKTKSYNHDRFEFSHRFIGWFLTLIIVGQIIYEAVINEKKDCLYIATATLLGMSCVLIIYPWMILIKAKVVLTPVSKLVTVISIPEKSKPIWAKPGTAGKVSLSYAGQCHPFALLGDLSGGKGATMAVSSVGDWTKGLNKMSEVNKVQHTSNSLETSDHSNLDQKAAVLQCKEKANTAAVDSEKMRNVIQNLTEQQQQHLTTLYIRRFGMPGFMYLIRTYKRVLCVGTGAGIAPIAAYLPCDADRMALLWVGRQFESTYGDLYKHVSKHENLVKIDSTLPNSDTNPYMLGEKTSKPKRKLSKKISEGLSDRFSSFRSQKRRNSQQNQESQRNGIEIENNVVDIDLEAQKIPGESAAAAVTKVRPNLNNLTLACAKLFDVDAIFVVSGSKPTYELCHHMWKHGYVVYGATFD